MRTVILIGVLSLAGGGCYNYQPLATPSPEAGTYVAARLSDGGSEELARYLGPNAFVVRGRYLGPSERGLLVSVSGVETKQGIDSPWEGETVTLPLDAITSLEIRKLSKGRSLLLASMSAGGLVVTTVAFSLIGSGTAPNAGGGRPGKQ